MQMSSMKMIFFITVFITLKKKKAGHFCVALHDRPSRLSSMTLALNSMSQALARQQKYQSTLNGILNPLFY